MLLKLYESTPYGTVLALCEQASGEKGLQKNCHSSSCFCCSLTSESLFPCQGGTSSHFVQSLSWPMRSAGGFGHVATSNSLVRGLGSLMLFFVHSMLRFFTLSLPPPASTQSTDKLTGGEGSTECSWTRRKEVHACTHKCSGNFW